MAPPKAPYENTYIGLFIFTLGVLAGRAEPDNERLVVPTLLQQTPKDGPLGDVLSEWGGRAFLIEFKRFESLVQNELFDKPKKHQRLSRWRAEHTGDSVSVPDRGHWIGFGSEPDQPPELSFIRYGDVRPEPEQAERRLSLEQFAAEVRSSTGAVGVAWAEFEPYLDHLAAADPQGAAGSVQGFLVSVRADGSIGVASYNGGRVQEIEFQAPSHAPTQQRTISREPPSRGRGGPSF